MSFRFSPLALGVAAMLVIGGGAGGFAAWMNRAAPPAPQLPDTFKVAETNTPGFPQIKRGDFELVDHNGNLRTSRSPDDKHQLLFFGYAKCKAICSVAIPNIAEAVNLLDGMGADVTPLLVTVDPKRDTVSALRKAVPDMHPKMIGMTGDEKALQASYDAFGLKKKFLFSHVDEGDIFSHGSFIYLLDPQGNFKTLFAPVTSPVRIAEVTAGYIREAQAKTQ